MSDNVVLNTGSGGQTCAADDCAGIQYQRVKLTDGTADSTTVIASGTGTASTSLRVNLATDVALPAGTNAIGKLAANSGVDIGDVDVTTVGTITPGTAATSLGKAEDAAHSSGDVGVMMLTVRQDTAAALAGTDGDYQPPITDSTGRLHVNVGNTVTVGSHAVTNAGTFAVQATLAAGATNIAKAEDVASADADVGVPAMAVRKATPANTSGTDGDYEFLQMSAGRLWASATIDAALPTGANVIGALTANQSVNNAQINGVAPLMGNGASGTGAQRVTIANDSTGILAGVTTVTTLSTLTGGAVAHDSADSGNPIKVGAKCSLTLSDDTIVANADRTDLTSDGDGALLVRGQFPLGDLISESVSNTNGTSTAFSNFGATASTRSYIHAYSIARTDAGTTPITVDFRDGTAGAVLWTVVVPPNGGANLSGALPLFRTTANTALAFDVSAGTTTVYISVAGWKSKV